MSFTAIVGAIVSVAKAVPIIADLIKDANNQIVMFQISKLGGELSQKEQKRKALIKALNNAENDNEIIALSIILADLNKL